MAERVRGFRSRGSPTWPCHLTSIRSSIYRRDQPPTDDLVYRQAPDLVEPFLGFLTPEINVPVSLAPMRRPRPVDGWWG